MDKLWSLLRLEQTLFALPFAYVTMALCADGWPGFWVFFWVTWCMVCARTAGMSLNRVIDRQIDAKNPRTVGRHLPAGTLSVQTVLLLALVSLAGLVWGASQLNDFVLMLSPLAVFLLVLYSFLKRFTWACHLGLGLVQACAPLGGWFAVSGCLETEPFYLAGAIFFWVGGFDILYACQDEAIDRDQGLHSIPRYLGAQKAFWVARAFHLTAFLFLVAFGVNLDLGVWYSLAVGITGSILVWEHQLLKPHDLSQMQKAFFEANATISCVLLLGVIAQLTLG